MIFIALRIVMGAGAAFMLLFDWPLGVALSLAVGLDFVLWISGVVAGFSVVARGGLALLVGLLGLAVSRFAERKKPGGGWQFSGPIVFFLLRATAYVEAWAMGGFKEVSIVLPIFDLIASSVAFAMPVTVAAWLRHRRAR